MSYEAVKCSQCGATLNVDSNQDTYECPFCGTKFQKKTNIKFSNINSNMKGNTFEEFGKQFDSIFSNVQNTVNSAFTTHFSSNVSQQQTEVKNEDGYEVSNRTYLATIYDETKMLEFLSLLQYEIISSTYINSKVKKIQTKRKIKQELANKLNPLEKEYINLLKELPQKDTNKILLIQNNLLAYKMVLCIATPIILLGPLLISLIFKVYYLLIPSAVYLLILLFVTLYRIKDFRRYKEMKKEKAKIKQDNEKRMYEIVQEVNEITR